VETGLRYWLRTAGLLVGALLLGVYATEANQAFAVPRAPHHQSASHQCLSPVGIRMSRSPLPSPSLGAPRGPRGLKGLLVRHRVELHHRHAVLMWAPDARHYLLIRAHAVYLGAPSRPLRRLRLGGYRDLAFAGGGRRIIFAKDPRYTRFRCASTVLISVNLQGRDRKVVFAGRFLLANALPGQPPQTPLQSNIVANGWIVLARGRRLWSYDPGQRRLAPLSRHQTPALSTGSGAGTRILNTVGISPNASYLVAFPSSSAAKPTIEELWSGHIAYRLRRAAGPLAWSREGRRVAFPILFGSGPLPQEAVETLDLHSGVSYVIRPPRRLGPVQVFTPVWSPDGRWIAVRLVPNALGMTCCRHTLISTWKGRHVRVLNGP